MVSIGSVKGYFFLDAWVMANIIQVATYRFCSRFLNKNNDPQARMYDQMTMAARSCPANIAEGCSRHQTSLETEMRLLDTARATLSELLSDYFFWTMAEKIEIWPKGSPEHRWVSDFKLEPPVYKDDWTREAQLHIRNQYARLASVIESPDNAVAINAMLILCNRTITMIERLLAAHLEEFKQAGGFTENLTKLRLESRVAQSVEEGAPECPVCGKPMIKRIAKKGMNRGNEFWSCSSYPKCMGTRPFTPVSQQ